MLGQVERVQLEVDAEKQVGHVVEAPFPGLLDRRPTEYTRLSKDEKGTRHVIGWISCAALLMIAYLSVIHTLKMRFTCCAAS